MLSDLHIVLGGPRSHRVLPQRDGRRLCGLRLPGRGGREPSCAGRTLLSDRSPEPDEIPGVYFLRDQRVRGVPTSFIDLDKFDRNQLLRSISRPTSRASFGFTGERTGWRVRSTGRSPLCGAAPTTVHSVAHFKCPASGFATGESIAWWTILSSTRRRTTSATSVSSMTGYGNQRLGS